MDLHEAARQGDVDEVRRLLAGGAEVDLPNEYEHTPLMEAASQGRTEVVRALLKAGADPRRLDSLALDFAVRLGNPDCVRLLIEAGADPNRVESEPEDEDEEDGDTGDPSPLFEAVQRGNLAMARMLVEAGARVDAVAEGEWGLLSAALRRDDPALFEWLWERKASPAGALRAVAETGKVQYLDRLLSIGLDLDEVGRFESTALALAAYYGRDEMVRRLIGLGADLHRRDWSGRTPLGQAVWEGKIGAAGALLDAGARLDLDDDGPLLTTAVSMQVSARLVRLLLEHGADPNEAGDGDPAPLLLAVAGKRPKVVAALLEHGADPDVRIVSPSRHALGGMLPKGMTPLMLAARKGSAPVVDLLLAGGADPTLLDAKGRSAADFAARAGRSALIDRLTAAGSPLSLSPRDLQSARLARAIRERDTPAALAALEAGADPDVADGSGKTALTDASKAGMVELVRALLASGADPDRTTEYGESPLRHACLRQNAEVVRLLIEAGADVNRRHAPGSVPADERNTAFPSLDTALHDAATYGSNEILKRLLAAGADRDAAGESGLTPLVAAVNFRRMDSARLLLDAGAVVRPEDELWMAPYRFARAAEAPAFRRLAAEVADACGAPAEPVGHLPGVVSFRLTLDPKADRPAPADPVEAGRRWGEDFSRDYAELSRKADEVLDRLAARARAEGFLLVDAGKPIGCGPMVQHMALLPTADPFEAMAAFGVRGNDQELSTADIIRWFRDLSAEEPFDLRGLKFDTVNIEFRAPVKDPDGLARRMNEFCHDLAGGEEDDWRTVAAWLRDGRRINFWWD